MRKLPLIASLVLLLCPAVLAQTDIEPPLITVTGQAEVRVTPDEVLFTLAVENVDRDMLVANKRTDDSVKQILSLARKHKVKPEDMQTSQISVEPKYNTDDMDYELRAKAKRVLVGYQVSKTIALRLRELDEFDELLADVLKAGITRLSNLEFRNSQIRKHRDEARRMAIRAAQEKANLLAREIGQSIGPAYSIVESGPTPYMPANASRNMIDNFVGGSPEAESPTAPGTISVTANVTVRFRLL